MIESSRGGTHKKAITLPNKVVLTQILCRLLHFYVLINIHHRFNLMKLSKENFGTHFPHKTYIQANSYNLSVSNDITFPILQQKFLNI